MKHANHDKPRRAWPKTEKIADLLGQSLRTVERAIAELRSVGALRTKRRHAANGAVLGLEFILIQVDPRLDLANTAVKVRTVHPANTGGKAASHPAKSDGAIPPPVAVSNKEEPDPGNQIQKDPVVSSSRSPRKRTLLDDYHDLFMSRHGEKPVLNGAKDGKLLKELVATHGADRVGELLVWFFQTRDAFISNSSYSVGVFYACFNKLQITCRRRVVQRDDELQQMRAKSETRKAELEREAQQLIAALSESALNRLLRQAAAAIESDAPWARHRMTPGDFDRCVTNSLVDYVLERCRRDGLSVADALTRMTAEPAA